MVKTLCRVAVKAGRPEKPKLTPARIVAATIELLDTGGAEHWSMRTLARRLRVNAMAIYHYFPDREALWRAAIEEAFSDLPEKVPDKQRNEAALELLLSYYAVARRHFHLARYLIAQGDIDVGAINRFNVALLGSLETPDLGRNGALLLRDLLIDYLHGYLMGEAHFTPREQKAGYKRMRATLRWILDSLTVRQTRQTRAFARRQESAGKDAFATAL